MRATCPYRTAAVSQVRWHEILLSLIIAISLTPGATSFTIPPPDCSIHNGGCQHSCVDGTPYGVSSFCVCDTTHMLAGDQRTCYHTVPLYLLYGDENRLGRMRSDGKYHRLLQNFLGVEMDFVAFDYDYKEGKVFFAAGSTDHDWPYIGVSSLYDGSRTRAIHYLPRTSTIVTLEVDWMRKKLIYLDSSNNLLYECNYNGTSLHVLFNITEYHGTNVLASGFAINPHSGYMYIATRSSVNRIIRANLLDGSNPIVFHESVIFQLTPHFRAPSTAPTSLTIDLAQGTLLWCDRAQSHIVSMSLNGGNVQYDSERNVSVPHLNGLATFQSSLWYTSPGFIHQYQLSTSQTRAGVSPYPSSLSYHINNPVAVREVHPLKQASGGLQVCLSDRDGCSQICSGSGQNVLCQCAPGWSLLLDGRTCVLSSNPLPGPVSILTQTGTIPWVSSKPTMATKQPNATPPGPAETRKPTQSTTPTTAQTIETTTVLGTAPTTTPTT
eukprot:scpid74278/ scgid27145/ Pro-epidermal growth factor; Epidermal growth factor; Urogastrone